jgi:hypothetical protein
MLYCKCGQIYQVLSESLTRLQLSLLLRSPIRTYSHLQLPVYQFLCICPILKTKIPRILGNPTDRLTSLNSSLQRASAPNRAPPANHTKPQPSLSSASKVSWIKQPKSFSSQVSRDWPYPCPAHPSFPRGSIWESAGVGGLIIGHATGRALYYGTAPWTSPIHRLGHLFRSCWLLQGYDLVRPSQVIIDLSALCL